MARNAKHVDIQQLRTLVFGDEESEEYRTASKHVEDCEQCRQKLDRFAGPPEIDAEATELLGRFRLQADSIGLENGVTASSGSFDEEDLEFLNPPGHPEMLGRLGRYEIERIIGSGGMGLVLKAFDTELNRPVAVKVLARHLAFSGAARERFSREAKAAAAVVHEHVVAIHNVESNGDLPFLVMQYIAGESLQSRVERDGPLDTKAILRIGTQAAAGLAEAHAQGVIHRDVKPANILLEEGIERALLTDFGLARTVDDASLTHTGVVAGTPYYMSPEQAHGRSVDHRSDLFSLGSVIYFMATGHPPFRGEHAMGVLHRICHDQHRPLWEVNSDIPDELGDFVDHLLEKRAVRRVGSASDVQLFLTQLLAKIQEPGYKRHGRIRRLIRRKRWLRSAIAATILFALVAFVTWRTWPGLSDMSTTGISNPEGSQNAATISAATDAYIAASRDVGNRISRLESMTQTSNITVSAGDTFQKRIESLDSRLDRIWVKPLQSTKQLLDEGE